MVSAWVDEMRAAFGKDEIDGQMRAGMKGAPVFYASENGHQVGTPCYRGKRVGFDPVTKCAIDLKGDGQ